jgi:Domain of unknown function (DUF4124)
MNFVSIAKRLSAPARHPLRRLITAAAVSITAMTASTGALAQPSNAPAASGNIWRCEVAGKVTYSSTPCPAARGAKALETLEPRNAADVREAQQRAAQERKSADALTREREAKEAREARQMAMQSRPANLGPEKAKPAPPKAEKATPNAGLRSRQPVKLGEQLRRGLDARRVDGDAGHGADLHALRLIEVAHALGAAGGVDHVNVVTHRDGLVGALGLADIAIDALVGDPQRHG